MKTALILLMCGVASAGPLDDLTRPQPYESRRASSSNEDLDKNGDARPIEPGGELVLADLEGPGIVTHFWNTVASGDPLYGRSLTLAIYYDGAEAPSVLCPLGDFFALGHGSMADYSSAVSSTSSHGRSKECYWRMPFQKRFKMVVKNEGTEKVNSFYYYLDWQKHEGLPEDTVYFHAHYRQQHPAGPGRHVLLEASGRGHYVGTVYSAHQTEMGWFGEGDDFFYIDGAEAPELRGTGTEDYFNDAWGFRVHAKPYSGVTFYDGVFPGDRVTAYRWHIGDPIPFTTSLRVEMEHRGSVFNPSLDRGGVMNFELGTFVERPDWISSVAYWYQWPPAKIESPLPPATERVAPYRIVKASALKRHAEPAMMVLPDTERLSYLPFQEEASIELTLNIEEPGTYQINCITGKVVVGGVYQAHLDGEPIGAPIDGTGTGADTVWTCLDLHKLEAGEHKLKFVSVPGSGSRRNLTPGVNLFMLEKLLLLRLEDMKGYHEVYEKLMQERGF